MRLGYVECYYIDVMKTLCNFLDRLDNKKNKQIKRDIGYGSGKFHYTEKRGEYQIYGFSDKSPLWVMKEIIERANTNLF